MTTKSYKNAYIMETFSNITGYNYTIIEIFLSIRKCLVNGMKKKKKQCVAQIYMLLLLLFQFCQRT